MKSNGKLTLLMIAVVALGAFALPSVLSLGTGQHNFVNGNEVVCSKCHSATNGGDINSELGSSGFTMKDTNGAGIGVRIHALDGGATSNPINTCESCHTQATPSLGDHTGVLSKPNCRSCHLTVVSLDGTTGTLANSAEAHVGFSPSAAGNAGCIGCHTAAGVSGTISGFSFDSSRPSAKGLTIS